MKKNIILSALLSTVITSVIFVLISYKPSQSGKVAYIKIDEVYNEFSLKKELENKLDNVRQTRKTIIDSLELQLKVLSGKLKAEKKPAANRIEFFSAKKQEYLKKKADFEQDNEEMINQYTAQIGKQLNQYVQDYGKENNYTYIYGADGSGTLMYADNSQDISKEVIAYINKRYKGVK